MSKAMYHGCHPAVYLILEKDGKFLMMRRANTGHSDGLYCVPAGHVEAGESMMAEIIREAAEEVGVFIQPEDLTFVHMQYRFSNRSVRATYHERIDVYFRTSKWNGLVENKEPHKCDDLQWFDFDKIPENTDPSCKVALKHIDKGSFYSEHGWEGK